MTLTSLRGRTVLVIGRASGIAGALGAEKKAELFAARERAVPRAASDIADAVLFALTNSFVTGMSLAVDGGEPLV